MIYPICQILKLVHIKNLKIIRNIISWLNLLKLLMSLQVYLPGGRTNRKIKDVSDIKEVVCPGDEIKTSDIFLRYLIIYKTII